MQIQEQHDERLTLRLVQDGQKLGAASEQQGELRHFLR